MFIWKANICQNKSLQTVLHQDEWGALGAETIKDNSVDNKKVELKIEIMILEVINCLTAYHMLDFPLPWRTVCKLK